jgi:hypothetical protein
VVNVQSLGTQQKLKSKKLPEGLFIYLDRSAINDVDEIIEVTIL